MNLEKMRPLAWLVLFAVLPPAVRAAEEAFDFEVLQFRAKNLAAEPYKEHPSHVPSSLLKYDYDEYRRIVYNRDRAWWRAGFTKSSATRRTGWCARRASSAGGGCSSRGG